MRDAQSMSGRELADAFIQSAHLEAMRAGLAYYEAWYDDMGNESSQDALAETHSALIKALAHLELAEFLRAAR